MKSTIEKVAEFHKMTNCPILETPTIPGKDRIRLRIELIHEELGELHEAALAGDVVGVADALTDLQYVLDGAYLEFGMKDIKEALFDEVHRSNMTKFVDEENIFAEILLKSAKDESCTWSEIDGKYSIVRNSDGKILKPSTYSPADLKAIVFPEQHNHFNKYEVGRKFIEAICDDNSINPYPLPETTKNISLYDSIAEAAQIFNDFNPGILNDETIQEIAAGEQGEVESKYGKMIGFPSLSDSLNDFFENYENGSGDVEPC